MFLDAFHGKSSLAKAISNQAAANGGIPFRFDGTLGATSKELKDLQQKADALVIYRSEVGFSMGAPTALFDTRLSREERWQGSPTPVFQSFDVAPDGKRFLVRAVREQGAEAPLVLVTNWQALLK